MNGGDAAALKLRLPWQWRMRLELAKGGEADETWIYIRGGGACSRRLRRGVSAVRPAELLRQSCPTGRLARCRCRGVDDFGLSRQQRTPPSDTRSATYGACEGANRDDGQTRQARP